ASPSSTATRGQAGSPPDPTDNETELITFILDLLDHGTNSPDPAHAVAASSLLAEAEARVSESRRDVVVQTRLLSGLADIHFRQGNFQRARQLMERSVAQAANVYGVESAQYMRARIGLARVLGRSGFTEAASMLYTEALTSIGQYQNVEQDLAMILNGMALIEMRKGKLGAAEQLLLGAVDVMGAAPGDPLEKANSLEYLATVYFETFRYKESLNQLQQAVLLRKGARGHHSRQLGYNLARQADVLLQLERPAEARAMANKALESLSVKNPTHQIGRAVAQVSLAKALLQLEELEPASENLLQGIELLKQQEPARAMMHLASATTVLGDLEDRLGERQKAEYYYRLSVAGYQKLLGKSHPRTQAALSRVREYASLN
ncbi:MAG: tetratricopeptide repeat protein, partial [Gammaproteobacteria bacterium]|nr:tetratricopeptide repeat protein [Gammaproteobacteria bacterium]